MIRSISSRQLAFLVLSSMIGVGILSLPRVLIEKAGAHAWVSVLLGGVFPIVGIWVQVALCKRHPKLDFVRLSRKLLGGGLGSVVSILFIIYGALMTALISRSFTDLIATMLFQRTPRAALLIIFLVAIAYVVQLGVRVVARLSELLFFLVLPIIFLLLPPLQVAEISNLLPLGEINLKGIGAGALSTAFSYLGFEILMFFYWQVEEQDEVLKYSWLATAYVILQYLFVVLTTLLVLGLELAQKFDHPVLVVLRVVPIPVIERLELLFAILYTALVFRTVANYFLLVSDTLCHLLGGRGMKSLPWLLLIPLSILGIFLRNARAAQKLLDMVGKVGLGLVLGVPLLLLGVSLMRGAHDE